MMNKPNPFKGLKILAVSAVAVMLLASCQSQEPPAQTVAVTPPKKAMVESPALPNAPGKTGEAAQAKPEAPKRRNPFSNYMLNVKAKVAEKGQRIKGPLECCELITFKLIAVVNAKDNSFGLVLTPDGKRYFVHAGDTIGMKEGKVVALDYHSFTVRENAYDESGKLSGHTDTLIKLPEESGLKSR